MQLSRARVSLCVMGVRKTSGKPKPTGPTLNGERFSYMRGKISRRAYTCAAFLPLGQGVVDGFGGIHLSFFPKHWLMCEPRSPKAGRKMDMRRERAKRACREEFQLFVLQALHCFALSLSLLKDVSRLLRDAGLAFVARTFSLSRRSSFLLLLLF